MSLTCVVVDKNGVVLSDKDIEHKVISTQRYYDIVLPIRQKINNMIFDKEKM